ncbi:MAG: PEP-utilizing enzyme [Candidatus Paceibacterota bacterium]
MKKRPENKIFGTKAETLERLHGHLKKSVVDKLVLFSVEDWPKEKSAIVTKIISTFPKKLLIVRSSAFAEDSTKQSNAGHFASLGNVKCSAPKIEKAVEEVISRYDGDIRNQAFVQEHITDVDLSGVVFTRDVNNLAPYMTINYDDSSGRTDTITSGQSTAHKTLVIYREKRPMLTDQRLMKVYAAVEELEKVLKSDRLDIEFLYKKGVVHILQARPLTAKTKEAPSLDSVSEIVRGISDYMRESNAPHPDLYGDDTFYGIMPDWNPAEMIGIKPRPLALSLYRELITDSIWAFQRDNYGYKRLRSFPLLVSLAGHPYIDLRVDFNSFIPKALDDDLSHRLVNFYLDKLRSVPASHDKIEFDIVYSCYTLDLDARLMELKRHGFSAKDRQAIKDSLLELTNKIIRPDGLYKEDLKKITTLKKRLKPLLESRLTEAKKIYWLIEDCKRYGTLPFAGIARAAFIAIQLLDSIVSLGIISIEEKNLFLSTMNTVARHLSEDMDKLNRGKLPIKAFLKKYGHLRPGTYDILSESYEENFHKYFDRGTRAAEPSADHPKKLTLSSIQMKKIDRLLKKHGLAVDADEFFLFMKEAIEGREYAKFVFTRNIHEILKSIKAYGTRISATPEDMSYVEIGALMKMHSAVILPIEERKLLEDIKANRARHKLNRFVKLPQLITQPEDLYHFYMDSIEPNYVTSESAIGNVATIIRNTSTKNIKGKIVCIENADPGFDWIFSHKIKGLITAYGGANSHMAIRAAELNIPAVIGCGPALFDKWSNAKKMKIDCLNKKSDVLS